MLAVMAIISVVRDLELARIGSQLFVFDSATCDQTAAPPLFDTFATRLSAQPLRERGEWWLLTYVNSLRF
jgi:hypothetical protein